MENGQVEIVEHAPSNREGWQSYKLAWTAYIRPFVMASIRVFLLSVLPAALLTSVFKKPMWVTPAIVVGALVNLALLTYDLIYLRSVVFSTNEDGVWVSRGILPWNKGISGVKWRDVSEAVYITGFTSWLLRSYTIRVGHKFTKDTELLLSGVWKGHEAVQHVNAVLMKPQLFFPR